MSRIPDETRRDVIREIYRRADDLDWDGLRPADRSTWYTRWLEDPAIGGVLDGYMARDQARMWIKDMPMKHYTRARSGIGPYSNLVRSRLPGADKLAELAFGPLWTPVEGSIQEKPNRCMVSDGNQKAHLIWGPPRAFQSLAWAALNAVIDEVPRPVIVVLTRPGERLTDGQVDRHRRMAVRVGVDIRHLTANTAREALSVRHP